MLETELFRCWVLLKSGLNVHSFVSSDCSRVSIESLLFKFSYNLGFWYKLVNTSVNLYVLLKLTCGLNVHYASSFVNFVVWASLIFYCFYFSFACRSSTKDDYFPWRNERRLFNAKSVDLWLMCGEKLYWGNNLDLLTKVAHLFVSLNCLNCFEIFKN